jgi:hypothetical protein
MSPSLGAACGWALGCATGAGVVWLRSQSQAKHVKKSKTSKEGGSEKKDQPSQIEKSYGEKITYRAIGECRSIFPTM